MTMTVDFGRFGQALHLGVGQIFSWTDIGGFWPNGHHHRSFYDS
jgi:hypothetical protein